MYELDPPEASARKAVQASIEFGAYLRDLLAERRAPAGRRPDQRPRRGRRRRRHAHREELIATCVLLLNAGPRGLGQRRRQRLVDAVPPSRRARPAARRARRCCRPRIEELLRFDTPLSLFERWVLEPIEVDGVEIRRGEEVALLFGSANRDPARFERPGRRSTSRATRTRTCRSGPASTTASARRWPSSSSGSRSRRCCGGRRGSSSSRRRAGSRPSSCAGSSRSASGSDGARALRRARRLVHDRDVGRARPSAGRTGWSPRSGRPSRGSSSWRTSGSTATPRPT